MGKICFIISSIGNDDSPERKSADEKYDLVYEPVLKELNYEPFRADKETTPNSISRDIIKRIIDSDLLIADISDENPNVFYELAVRNAIKKPVIIIMASGQIPPFDIKDKRALVLNMKDNRQWLRAKDLLKEYIQSAENHPDNASVSILSDFEFNLATSNIEGEKERELDVTLILKDIMDGINRLTSMIGSAQKPELNYPTSPGVFFYNTDPWQLPTVTGISPRFGSGYISKPSNITVNSIDLLEGSGSIGTLNIDGLTVRQLINLIYEKFLKNSFVPNDYGKTWILRNEENTRLFIFGDFDKQVTEEGIFPGMHLVISGLPWNH
jgi:hypothetical protein